MTGGPADRDESVQFSLKELLELEDERVAEQRRRVDEETRARARERERAAEAERSARSAEEESRRAREAGERRAELDEIARREAMQKAVVEQARLEVEARARGEERERERQHELALARLRTTTQAGEAGLGAMIGAASIGGGVMLAVLLGIHFGVTGPATARRLADAERVASLAETKVDELARRDEEQRRAIAGLERRLDDAQRELAARPAARTPPAAPPPASKPTSSKSTTVRPAAKPNEPTCANAWDPMCGALPR